MKVAVFVAGIAVYLVFMTALVASCIGNGF